MQTQVGVNLARMLFYFLISLFVYLSYTKLIEVT